MIAYGNEMTHISMGNTGLDTSERDYAQPVIGVHPFLPGAQTQVESRIVFLARRHYSQEC